MSTLWRRTTKLKFAGPDQTGECTKPTNTPATYDLSKGSQPTNFNGCRDNFVKQLHSISLANDTIGHIAENVERQIFRKLHDKLFSIQLDEVTDSNKGAHLIVYFVFL